MWAKVTNFVMNRTTALSSVMVETAEGKPPSTVTVKAATFDSEHEFFEALNLFIMWTTALRLGSASCVHLLRPGLRLRHHPRAWLLLAICRRLFCRGPLASRTQRGAST